MWILLTPLVLLKSQESERQCGRFKQFVINSVPAGISELCLYHYYPQKALSMVTPTSSWKDMKETQKTLLWLTLDAPALLTTVCSKSASLNMQRRPAASASTVKYMWNVLEFDSIIIYNMYIRIAHIKF